MNNCRWLKKHRRQLPTCRRDDVEGNGLMRVAAKAFHFEIAIAHMEGITQRGRWLRRTLKAQHPLVPRLNGEPVGLLACFRRPLCRRPDRSAVNGLA